MKVHKLIHQQLPMVCSNLLRILPIIYRTLLLALTYCNIFTDQQSLVVDRGVHPFLHKNCHHQITHYKFNLISEYLPPYQHLVWDYKRANVNSIKQVLYQVNWSAILSDKDVHQQVNIKCFHKLCI